MAKACCIPGCQNTKPKYPGTIFCLPVQDKCKIKMQTWAVRLKKLLFALRNDEEMADRYKRGYVRVCEEHFLEKDMIKRGSRKKLLKPALPSRNLGMDFLSDEQKALVESNLKGEILEESGWDNIHAGSPKNMNCNGSQEELACNSMPALKLPKCMASTRAEESLKSCSSGLYALTLNDVKNQLKKNPQKRWQCIFNDNDVTLMLKSQNDQFHYQVCISSSLKIGIVYYGWAVAHSSLLDNLQQSLLKCSISDVLEQIEGFSICKGCDADESNHELISHVVTVSAKPFNEGQNAIASSKLLARSIKELEAEISYLRNETKQSTVNNEIAADLCGVFVAAPHLSSVVHFHESLWKVQKELKNNELCGSQFYPEVKEEVTDDTD